jgi:hypothetical protein
MKKINQKSKKKFIKKKFIKKKFIKKKFIKKKFIKKKIIKKNKLTSKKIIKIKKKSIRKSQKVKKKIKAFNSKIIKKKSQNILIKLINFQEKLKPKFKFDFQINLGIEKFIQSFFDNIANKIEEYNNLKKEEKRRKRLEELEKIEKDKINRLKLNKIEEELRIKNKEKAIKEEAKLEKERIKDIKLFLRKEQAIVRKEQAEKQRQFLKQLQLDRQIEKFRIREVKELEKLEKISLKEKREDYAGLQERIEKLKEKYRVIRDQKIRERVEALGVKIQGNEDRETLLQKEKQYTITRQKIELSLESFYRSASSLVFQLNKRHITRHMSIFRCVDRRFETGEIFIKWDESADDDWLILIYIKDNSPDQGIVIEDKSNPEKNSSYEFKSSEIFRASDLMVDSLTQLIAKVRQKKD